MSKHLTTTFSNLLQTSKMPAFTLYGARGSTNTDRVRLTLAEGGFADYDFVSINLMKGEQKVGIYNLPLTQPFPVTNTAAQSLSNT
jgi:hypothetical protein